MWLLLLTYCLMYLSPLQPSEPACIHIKLKQFDFFKHSPPSPAEAMNDFSFTEMTTQCTENRRVTIVSVNYTATVFFNQTFFLFS